MLSAMSHPSLSAVATFNGLQETPDCAPWFAQPVPLWTLTQPVRGLLVGSTYAEATLRAALRNAVLAEEADATCAAEFAAALTGAMGLRELAEPSEAEARAVFGHGVADSLRAGMLRAGLARRMRRA